MHTMAFRSQPSSPTPASPPSKYDTPPMLRRTSSIWIRDGSESSESSSYDEDCAYVMNGPTEVYDLPTVITSSSSSNAPSKSKWSKTVITASCTALLLGTAYYMGGVHARRPLELKLHQAEELKSALLENQSRLLSEKSKLSRLPKVNQELTQTIEEMQKQLADKERALHDEEHRRLSREEELLHVFGQYQLGSEERDQHERQRRDDLAKFLKTMAYDHYGTETRDVEFHVRLWEGDESTEGTFVVEVADFDSMPISAFLFLQQVEHGLWDKTSFYVNAPHVVLAQPISGRKDVNRLPEMEAMGLARLPLPEYSDDMKHEKYTLGFGSSLSTAGSFFFINKVDNSHSQAGQACFARVVEGMDVVDRIMSLQADEVDFRIQPVDIVSVKLLEYDQESPVGENHHLGHPHQVHHDGEHSHQEPSKEEHHQQLEHHEPHHEAVHFEEHSDKHHEVHHDAEHEKEHFEGEHHHEEDPHQHEEDHHHLEVEHHGHHHEEGHHHDEEEDHHHHHEEENHVAIE